jgi:hypothetical protein
MLYKFKSKVTSDVLMLERNGQEILQIIGKYSADKPHQGIITPQEMPAAIEALESALHPPTATATRRPSDDTNAPEEPAEITVELRQRIIPFLQMLRQCVAHQQPIVWGV